MVCCTQRNCHCLLPCAAHRMARHLIINVRCAQDGTSLFQKYHPWVNIDALMEKCLVGMMAPPPSAVPPLAAMATGAADCSAAEPAEQGPAAGSLPAAGVGTVEDQGAACASGAGAGRIAGDSQGGEVGNSKGAVTATTHEGSKEGLEIDDAARGSLERGDAAVEAGGGGALEMDAGIDANAGEGIHEVASLEPGIEALGTQSAGVH